MITAGRCHVRRLITAETPDPSAAPDESNTPSSLTGPPTAQLATTTGRSLDSRARRRCLVVRGRRHHLWHRHCLLDQLVSDYLEGLDVLLRARENDGALCACDEEGHEALRGGTENADLLVEVDEEALRGPEDRPGTV